MTKHITVLKELTDKYKKCSDVRGILVYGSVARGTETENSDIDLWVYKSCGGFTHSTDRLHGIKIDLFEISVPLLEKFISGREAPAINSLLDGKLLYNKDMDIDGLISLASDIKNQKFVPIDTMPKNRIINVLIQLMDLIDDARDLTDDKLRFRLLFSEVIVGVYNNLYDFFGIWRGSPKNTLQIFEKELPDIYPLLHSMLDDSISPSVQVENAAEIVNIMAKKYGGIPTAHIITEISK